MRCGKMQPMNVQAWLSQGLLLIVAGLMMLSRLDLDAAVISLLIGVLIAILMNYLSGRHSAALPHAAFLALCFVFPELIVFVPLMLYLSLRQAGWPWYAFSLVLPLMVQFERVDTLLLLAALAAGLLVFKDEGTSRLLARYYDAVDASSVQRAQSQLQVRSLQREQEAQVQLAVMQERNRIARDIHDHVGHVLSRGILQARALGLSLKNPRQQQDMKALQDTLNSGMTAIRASVHNMPQDFLALDAEIKGLLDDFTFCPVRYTNSNGSQWPLKQKYAAIAVIKEALSNIMKHSNATLASITLSELRDSRLLLIQDNGTQPSNNHHSGLGLYAMEERVRGLGGSLRVTRDKGFRILITLPKEDSHDHINH
ncbi:MAG: hypothetical protein GXZ04_00210 [Clostridiales bacterium]|nr:hypothetical protein [Clostridiales bacterium]